MDLHTTLTIITVVGLAITFIAGITSQLWKDSIEVEGLLTKRLTPAGWLSLGLALVGLSGSVASELIRVTISNNEKLQAKAEEAQKKALREQEERWRNDMRTMLAATKTDIEKNLDDTIRGFQDSQARFAQTQAEIIASKQTLLESGLRQTNEIILAGQPLTSLSLHWQFDSASAELWQTMAKGRDEITKNGYTSQGGVPEVPFDVMEYNAALLPLISYVARSGGGHKAGDTSETGQARDSAKDSSIVVLMPLDESQNAILSFGNVAQGVSWSENRDAASISAGFIESPNRRQGNSTPGVTAELAETGNAGMSSYAVDWNLDPGTLANAFDRRNEKITPTARLPGILKIVIFYDVGMLPFQQNNFAVPHSDVWKPKEPDDQDIALGQDFSNMMLKIKVNGVREMKYGLKRMYRTELLNEFDDDIDTGCVILEFEPT